MPDLPDQHRPPGYKPRKAWEGSAHAPNRLRGRKNQQRKRRVHERDDWTCHTCHRITAQLQVDHIIPLSEGGKDVDENKQSICIPCHAEKSKRERAKLAGGHAD